MHWRLLSHIRLCHREGGSSYIMVKTNEYEHQGLLIQYSVKKDVYIWNDKINIYNPVIITHSLFQEIKRRRFQTLNFCIYDQRIVNYEGSSFRHEASLQAPLISTLLFLTSLSMVNCFKIHKPCLFQQWDGTWKKSTHSLSM